MSGRRTGSGVLRMLLLQHELLLGGQSLPRRLPALEIHELVQTDVTHAGQQLLSLLLLSEALLGVARQTPGRPQLDPCGGDGQAPRPGVGQSAGAGRVLRGQVHAERVLAAAKPRQVLVQLCEVLRDVCGTGSKLGQRVVGEARGDGRAGVHPVQAPCQDPLVLGQHRLRRLTALREQPGEAAVRLEVVVPSSITAVDLDSAETHAHRLRSLRGRRHSSTRAGCGMEHKHTHKLTRGASHEKAQQVNKLKGPGPDLRLKATRPLRKG